MTEDKNRDSNRENDWGNQTSPDHRENLDSPINTAGTQGDSTEISRTNDEDSSQDPNKNPDKASFTNQGEDLGQNDRGRFDGEIRI